ncbi:MAG: hemerythrin domain-containing protein [archaeon]
MKTAILILKKEHEQINDLLSDIEAFYKDDSNSFYLTTLFKRLNRIWDEHELREERIFQVSKEKGMPFPNETMLLQEHRELKGHWKVIEKALAKGNKKEIRTSLDTDCKMLISKFKNHIAGEEDYFDVLIEKENSSQHDTLQ